MRVTLTILLALTLAGCDRRSERSVPIATNAAPVAPSHPTPASIMRPDIATPAPAPPAFAPLDLTIGFPDGGAELGAQQTAELDQLAASPQIALGGPIRLAAHSDSAGTDAANLAVSRKRGEAVREWLREHGIAADRISLIAFGEQNPVRPNAAPDGSPDEAGRAANRRVEIHVPVPDARAATAREPTLAEEIVEETQTGDLAASPTEVGAKRQQR